MKISQREARRLKKQVEELLRDERSRLGKWAMDWPGGVNVASTQWGPNDVVPVAIRTARLLGHAVVAMADSNGLVRFMALKLKSEV